MFAGYMLASFLGMLLGPMLALLLKAVLASDEELAAPVPKPIAWPWQKKRGAPLERGKSGHTKGAGGGNHPFREKKK